MKITTKYVYLCQSHRDQRTVTARNEHVVSLSTRNFHLINENKTPKESLKSGDPMTSKWMSDDILQSKQRAL